MIEACVKEGSSPRKPFGSKPVWATAAPFYVKATGGDFWSPFQREGTLRGTVRGDAYHTMPPCAEALIAFRTLLINVVRSKTPQISVSRPAL